MVNQPMAVMSFSRGVDPTTISRATGVIIAPPRPCRMREATRASRFRDRPHRAEPSRKTTMAQMNTRRDPNRSAAQPLTGVNTAKARM